MSRADERKKAAELKVLDARDLIKDKLPFLLKHLTNDQIDKVQRQLDVEIINAAIDQELAELQGSSVVGRTTSGKPVHDPAKVASPDKLQRLKNSKLVVRDVDTIIRLDVRKLLTANALVPTSDNPDEASYLIQVKAALASRGIFFRVYSNRSQLARTQYTDFKDHRRWIASMWFGSDTRDEIKTNTGELNRKAVFSIPPLGAGYYHYVHNGPTQRLLKQAIDSVRSKISWAQAVHADLDPDNGSLRGRLLTWGMTELVGQGMLVVKAKYPGKRAWEEPHQLLIKASTLIGAGKLMEGNKLVVLAAFQVEAGMNALAEYAHFINATKGGVGTALQVLQFADSVGDIAEMLLFLRAAGGGLFRLLSRGGTTTVVEGAGVSRSLPAPMTTKPTAAYEAAIKKTETTIQSVVPQARPMPAAAPRKPSTAKVGDSAPSRPAGGGPPKSSGSGRPNSGGSGSGGNSSGIWDHNQRMQEEWWDRTGYLAHQQDLKQYMDYVTRELKHLKKINPNPTMAEKRAIIERADQHWGSWLPGDGGGMPAKYWGEEFNVDLVTK